MNEMNNLEGPNGSGYVSGLPVVSGGLDNAGRPSITSSTDGVIVNMPWDSHLMAPALPETLPEISVDINSEVIEASNRILRARWVQEVRPYNPDSVSPDSSPQPTSPELSAWLQQHMDFARGSDNHWFAPAGTQITVGITVDSANNIYVGTHKLLEDEEKRLLALLMLKKEASRKQQLSMERMEAIGRINHRHLELECGE